MATIIQGRIVYALDAIPDPQGRNPKPDRPFVVVSSNAELARDDNFDGVGVSRDVYGKEEEVELEWGHNSRTGLKVKSAAICTWKHTFTRDRVNIGNGYVKPKYLREILQKCG